MALLLFVSPRRKRKGGQLRMSWAKLFRRFLFPALLALLFLLQPLRQSGPVSRPELVNRAQPTAPVCPSLPTHGPEQQFSVFVVPTKDRPGIVCVRVYNGMPDTIYYEGDSLRLERRWFRLLWLPPFQLSFRNRLSGCKPVYILGVDRVVRSGGQFDIYLPSVDEPTPPGTYRVRLQYRLPGQDKEQTVYSEEFAIP